MRAPRQKISTTALGGKKTNRKVVKNWQKGTWKKNKNKNKNWNRKKKHIWMCIWKLQIIRVVVAQCSGESFHFQFCAHSARNSHSNAAATCFKHTYTHTYTHTHMYNNFSNFDALFTSYPYSSLFFFCSFSFQRIKKNVLNCCCLGQRY